MPGRHLNFRLGAPLLLVGLILLVALVTPLLPLADPVKQDIAHRLATSSPGHWLGQDEYGRDVLSRILWGGRVSLGVAFTAAAIAGLMGTTLGILGAFFRGWTELVTIRAAEIVLCFPPLLLALLVVTVAGPGAATLLAVLGILYAPGFARVAYGQTLSVREVDYVTAQTALGAGPGRILIRTILPNVAPPLIVQFSLTVASAMVLESGLSFLGLGVVPPAPSWGLMIRGARATMEQAPLLLLWPCLALTGTVLALNTLCDRLRDVLDPSGSAALVPGFLGRKRAPIAPAREGAGPAAPLLSVRNVTLALGEAERPIPLINDLSFDLASGETLAIVGESGSGKTLTGLSIMGLLPGAIRPLAGEIRFRARGGTEHELLRSDEAALRALRGRDIAMVFQDPSTSLNPLLKVGDPIAETIAAHEAHGPARGEVAALLAKVGLPDAERRVNAYPHELSGGQRQRVMIAAAIANHPSLLIADEPTTALDVTVQAQILALLASLRDAERGMSMILISHNLAVVAQMADRVLVMYAGEIVESGPVAEVFARPRHPYTAALLASIPEGDAPRLSAIPGQVPLPSAMPPGCRFAPRCAMAEAACMEAPPALVALAGGRQTRCRRSEEMR